jgi:hypothetical protein
MGTPVSVFYRIAGVILAKKFRNRRDKRGLYGMLPIVKKDDGGTTWQRQR